MKSGRKDPLKTEKTHFVMPTDRLDNIFVLSSRIPRVRVFLWPALTAVVSGFYGFAALAAGAAGQSIAAILYIAFLCLVFVRLGCEPVSEADGGYAELMIVCACVVALYAGIYAGFSLGGSVPEALWPKDAFDTHLPRAVNFANYLKGIDPISPPYDSYDRLYLTHVLAGISFFIAGVSPGATLLTLALLKMTAVISIFFLGSGMFSRKTGFLAALIYALMPTVLFYTINYYKEAAVHLLVAATLYSAWEAFVGGRAKRGFLFVFPICVLALLNERFYVGVFILSGIAAYRLSRIRRAPKAYVLAGGFFLTGVAVYVLNVRLGIGMDAFLDPSLFVREFAARIENLRAGYSSYSDVNAINYRLPYPVAFLKLLFTPFFSLNKFSLFSAYACLLIWGAVVNQAVILTSILGSWHAFKAYGSRNVLTVVPFFLFLAVFSSIAAYNGRVRDSFYPVISVYAAYFMALRGWPTKATLRFRGRVKGEWSSGKLLK